MQPFRLLTDDKDKDPVADWDEGVELEGIKCPVSPGHQRAGRRIGPLRITLRRGFVPDLIWTWGSDLLITDFVRGLLEDHRLTGFSALPAEARFDEPDAGAPAPKLWEFQTTGWAGVARAESGVRLVERTPCCDHLRYSGCTEPTLLIDESQWDGSDFFMVWPLPRYHFLSHRAALLILEHELTGGRLLHLDEVNPIDGFTPGRLSYWMPGDRARQLGTSLGIA